MLAENIGLVTAADMSVRRYTHTGTVVTARTYLLALPVQLDGDEVVELFGELAILQSHLQTLLNSFHF